jgi:hypothetical protein
MNVFGFERVNLLKVALVAMAALLAACLLALAVSVEPSQAAFPGQNGKIAFVRNPDPNESQEDIYTMNADGSNETNITNSSPADETQPAWSPNGN